MNYDRNANLMKEDIVGLLAQAKDVWVNFGASTVDFFKSYAFKEIIFTLKTISLILSILALIAIIFIFFKMNALGKPAKQIAEAKEGKKKIKKVLKKWLKIEKKFKSGKRNN